MITIKEKENNDYNIQFSGELGNITTEMVALMSVFYQTLIEEQDNEVNKEVKAKRAMQELMKVAIKANIDIETDKIELENVYENR